MDTPARPAEQVPMVATAAILDSDLKKTDPDAPLPDMDGAGPCADENDDDAKEDAAAVSD